MTTHDRQTVLDAAQLEPSLRTKMITVYRELAAFDRLSGRIALAEYSEQRAAALEFGGRITLAAILEERL